MTQTNEVPMKYITGQYLNAFQIFRMPKMKYWNVFYEMTKTDLGRRSIIAAMESDGILDDFVGFCEWIDGDKMKSNKEEK